MAKTYLYIYIYIYIYVSDDSLLLAIYSPKLFETYPLKKFKFKNVYVLTHPFVYDFMHVAQRPAQVKR